MFPPKDSRLIEHEVAPLPGLTPAESSLLDLHSLLNATQVLMGELNLAGFIIVLHLNIALAAISFLDCGTHRLFDGVDQQGPIYALVPANLVDNLS